MEENKYFKPEIEDIRVGYELEYYNMSMDEIGEPELNYSRWEKSTLLKGNVETFMKYGIGNGVRVKYLTGEQIKEEGWKYEYNAGTSIVFEKQAGKSMYYTKMYYCDTTHILEIVNPNSEIAYKGTCNDINTFRLIIKLLNI